MVREAAKQPHTDPLVTVAIRSDGSVESVTFVLSSGVAAIDEAIRRIVDSQKPYQVFPPGLAREFDVILIRRSWYFDTAIRLRDSDRRQAILNALASARGRAIALC